jgi:hypothetical protein
MRWLLLLALALPSLGVMAADPQLETERKDFPAKTKTTSLTVGADLPGPFHPFNINGKRKSSFSCPISATGLGSGVLLLVRDLEGGPAFKELLQKLDNAVEKNLNVPLSVHVVFLSDDLKVFLSDDVKEAVAEDDKREELVGKINDMVKDLMLKHLVLSVTGPADLTAYHLPDDAVYTLVAYHKYQVRAVESMDKDKLTADKVQALLVLLGEKLGVTRK